MDCALTVPPLAETVPPVLVSVPPPPVPSSVRIPPPMACSDPVFVHAAFGLTVKTWEFTFALTVPLFENPIPVRSPEPRMVLLLVSESVPVAPLIVELASLLNWTTPVPVRFTFPPLTCNVVLAPLFSVIVPLLANVAPEPLTSPSVLPACMVTFAEALLVKELEAPPIKLVVPAMLWMVPLLVTAAPVIVAEERSSSLVASTVTAPPVTSAPDPVKTARPPLIDRIVPPALLKLPSWRVSFPPLA